MSLIEVFLADATARRQFVSSTHVRLGKLQGGFFAGKSRGCGIQVRNLSVNVLDRVLEFEAIGTCGGHIAAHGCVGRSKISLGRIKSRFLDCNLDLVWL